MMDIECILELPEKFKMAAKMANINKSKMATKINAFHKKAQGQEPGKGQKHIFVISQLLVRIERSDWAQTFLWRKIYSLVKVTRPYMCSVGLEVDVPPKYKHKRTAYYGRGMLTTECPSIVHIELVHLEKS